jgi:hypothetical protein
VDASDLPIYSKLLELHASSDRKIWIVQGQLAWNEANCPMPPLAKRGARPGTIDRLRLPATFNDRRLAAILTRTIL